MIYGPTEPRDRDRGATLQEVADAGLLDHHRSGFWSLMHLTALDAAGYVFVSRSGGFGVGQLSRAGHERLLELTA